MLVKTTHCELWVFFFNMHDESITRPDLRSFVLCAAALCSVFVFATMRIRFFGDNRAGGRSR